MLKGRCALERKRRQYFLRRKRRKSLKARDWEKEIFLEKCRKEWEEEKKVVIRCHLKTSWLLSGSLRHPRNLLLALTISHSVPTNPHTHKLSIEPPNQRHSLFTHITFCLSSSSFLNDLSTSLSSMGQKANTTVFFTHTLSTISLPITLSTFHNHCLYSVQFYTLIVNKYPPPMTVFRCCVSLTIFRGRE